MPYRTDIAYLYDGSFEGLLTCVHESYYKKELPLLIFNHDEVQETLFPVKEITTDIELAAKVKDSVKSKISGEALRLVRLCYYSNTEAREVLILNFLRLGYKVGSKVTSMLAHDTVRPVIKTAQAVSRESYFFLEFLRFSDYDGALVAIIEPKNFVLPMMYSHFCDRFPSEQFLIYDKTNNYAFAYHNGEKNLFLLDKLELPEVGEKELMYRTLWKQFYKTIAIEGRINLKLRMSNMPKRYWTHMTEFL